MSIEYRLEARFKPRNGWAWFIVGLPHIDYDGVEYPDTELHMVGMYHACDTPDSVVRGVYRALYDEHQVRDHHPIPDGAVITSESCRVNVYLNYDGRFGQLDVPAMRFRVHSYHIEMEEPDPSTLTPEAEDEP